MLQHDHVIMNRYNVIVLVLSKFAMNKIKSSVLQFASLMAA